MKWRGGRQSSNVEVAKPRKVTSVQGGLRQIVESRQPHYDRLEELAGSGAVKDIRKGSRTRMSKVGKPTLAEKPIKTSGSGGATFRKMVAGISAPAPSPPMKSKLAYRTRKPGATTGG